MSRTPSSSPWLCRTCIGCASAAVGIAGVGGAGWAFGNHTLGAFGADLVPMAPLTALALLGLGGTLLVREFRPDPPIWRWVAAGVAGFAALGGLLVLGSHLYAVPSVLDLWLAPTETALREIPLGRMAPSTAAVLVTAALSLLLDPGAPGIHPARRHAAAALGTLVVATGALVILGYASGTPWAYGGTHIPMALSTALAVALLGLGTLLPAAVGLWWPALAGDSLALSELNHAARRSNATLLLILGSVVTVIGSVGFVAFQRHQAATIEHVRDELLAIADLTMRRIDHWRAERLQDGAFFAAAPFAARDVAALLSRPDDPAAQGELVSWLRLLRTSNRYANAVLYAPDGRELAALRPTSDRFDRLPPTALRPDHPGVWLSDLIDSAEGTPHFVLQCPIHPPRRSATDPPIALLALTLEPENFLFPLLAAWPTASPSAEILLVRRNGPDVVYLNPLRHRPGPGRALRVPGDSRELAAALALRAGGGLTAGRDYRGERVLTAFVRVPDTSWWVGAKIDQAEVYAPLRRQALGMGAVVLGFALLSLQAAALLWRRREAGWLGQALQAERERRHLADQLDLVVRHANDVIWLYDLASARFVYVSPSVQRLRGYTVEEAQAQTLEQALAPGSARVVASQLPHRLARFTAGDESSRTESIELELICQGGTTVPTETATSIIADEQGRPTHIQGVTRDLTERKRYERRLHLLLQAIQQLARAREIGEVAASVCPTARELAGADGATFVLREADHCHYVDEDAVAPLWKGRRFPLAACISGWAMQHNEPAVLADVFADPRVPHDAYRPTFVRSLAMLPIRTAGEAPGALGAYWARIHEPTPEERQLLQTLADAAGIALQNVRHYAELGQRVRERTLELEAANRELEAFSYSVSHDLRAPLRAVDGFSRLLEEEGAGRLDDRGRDHLRRVRAAAGRMGQLIEDLLALSRVTRTGLHRAPVNLSALARTVAAGLHAAHPDRKVELIVADTPVVPADARLVRVVLENLLGNAWKFTARQPRARIEFGAGDGPGAVEFFVRDNGAGFDPAQAGRLFGAFQRLHSEAEFPGTGIGLALVQRIIQRHGGSLGAEGTPGAGATFRFSLAPHSLPA
jgi:PAS domain S-box-containing protein